MPGTYTTDEIRAVRLNIPDAEAIYGEGENEYLFDDTDIAIFLDQASGNAMWAAGIAMIAVGNSEAMIGKVIRNYETETDASKLQREWRSAGVEMIKIGKLTADEGAGFFEVVYPEWGATRHPEGELHGSYRMPTPYQW
jgi:hypothetical protein